MITPPRSNTIFFILPIAILF